jgi:hypothetical protein
MGAVSAAFNYDSRVAPKVVIALFTRIWDLHNFDSIIRQISEESCKEIAKKLGSAYTVLTIVV